MRAEMSGGSATVFVSYVAAARLRSRLMRTLADLADLLAWPTALGDNGNRASWACRPIATRKYGPVLADAECTLSGRKAMASPSSKLVVCHNGASTSAGGELPVLTRTS
ncbi:hypothetical protein, partial [Candidatus Frankia alpina]|uniref:hypothetical protein n=1 Tax=Candidatus Frankia alpina TaxID=2699483 RepID=UPI001967281F